MAVWKYAIASMVITAGWALPQYGLAAAILPKPPPSLMTPILTPPNTILRPGDNLLCVKKLGIYSGLIIKTKHSTIQTWEHVWTTPAILMAQSLANLTINIQTPTITRN